MEEDFSVKGYNWGQISVTSDEVTLSSDGFLILKTTPKNFTKCTLNKGEVSVEFDDDKEGDALSEIKFATPQTDSKADKDIAQELYEDLDKVTSKEVPVKEICILEDISFLTPKGHYSVKIYDDSLRIQNGTYDFKVKYKDISVIYKLKKKDKMSFLVLRLSKVLRKGKSEYDSMIMELSDEKECVCCYCNTLLLIN